MVCIRKAVPQDLDVIKSLVDAHKYELGFVLRPALLNSIQDNEVFIAVEGENLLGMLEYHHRRDIQTTLYHLVVSSERHRQNIGSQLIRALESEARQLGKHYIQLKCPEDLPANSFYQNLGFELFAVENGRARKLNVWRLSLTT